MRNKVSPIPISQYFVGEKIFITGGTGFMGKVLVEKILRCCPEVEKIYLLVRPKKEKSIEQRWDEMNKIELFEKLKSSNPDAMKKIQPVAGDITKANLGLSEETLEILRDNVTIVYHAAAMIQFRDLLVEVINNNTKATHTVLQIARSMKQIKVFVHISTSFSNSNLPSEESVEEVLPAVQDWKVMLELCDREPLTIAFMKEKLLCGHPNPYTFSKSLAEQIVDDYKYYFPTVIMRPAIVGPCVRDPLQGWTDVICGVCAVSLPASLGLLRVMFTSDECGVDYVPADTAINATILATAKKLSEPMVGQTDVYNCACMKDKPITVYDIRTIGKPMSEQYASKYIIWSYHLIFTTNEFLYRTLFFFLNVIPAILIDLLLRLTFNEPRILNLVKKCSNVLRIFKKFSSGHFAFPNDKFKELGHFPPEEEKKTFPTHIDEFSVSELLTIGYVSTLKFYLKEDASEEALKKNRRRLRWLKVLDLLVIYGFYAICTRCLYLKYFT